LLLGDICLDILKKEWSPAWGLQAACRAVLALLSDPDAESPLNCDAGNMLRGNDRLAYESTAAMYTVENAHFIDWPPLPKETAVDDSSVSPPPPHND
jgi:peroxin-4